MPFGWKVAFFLAVAPQMYWYFLMWRGLLRMLVTSNDKGKKELEYNRKKKSDDTVTDDDDAGGGGARLLTTTTPTKGPPPASFSPAGAAELNNRAKEFAH